jgi:YHS domain-containing protein
VTDNKLGSMGTPITKVYADQEVKFCCKPCIAKFEKDPQRYLAKLP